MVNSELVQGSKVEYAFEFLLFAYLYLWASSLYSFSFRFVFRKYVTGRVLQPAGFNANAHVRLSRL